MKNVGIVINSKRDIDFETTREIIDLLQKKDCNIFIDISLQNALADFKDVIFSDDIYKDMDFVIVLGGDGTMLQTAQHSLKYETPIMGINLGHMGYLTDVEKHDAEIAIDKIFAGIYKCERRMMIDVSYENADGEVTHMGSALNDAYVLRSHASKLVDIQISVNDEYIDSYRCDGIIVSTPTGSTAYNLSAGGPILKPDSEMIAITPICPHTLYARPFVVSSKDEISIKPKCPYNNKMVVCIDGYDELLLGNGNTVKIKQSNYYTNVIKTNELGFYDILRLKMVGEVKK